MGDMVQEHFKGLSCKLENRLLNLKIFHLAIFLVSESVVITVLVICSINSKTDTHMHICNLEVVFVCVCVCVSVYA